LIPLAAAYFYKEKTAAESSPNFFQKYVTRREKAYKRLLA
jgi:hypothetical protein